MEPHNSHRLLFFSLFSLLTFNSAQAICVPRNSTNSDLSLPPTLQPVSSPEPTQVPSPSPSSVPSQDPASVPPVSDPLSQSILQTSPIPPPKSSIPLLSSVLQAVPSLAKVDPAINQICTSTDYPNVCLSSIAPYLNGKTDPMSVVEMAIKAANEYTKLAITTATKLGSTPGLPPKMVSTINDIKDSYSDALDNFQKAMDALPNRDVGTMNSMLSAAITDFSDCDDDLAGQSSPLLDLNAKLSKMTSNCLAIVSLIK